MQTVTNGKRTIGKSNYDGSYWIIHKNDRPNTLIGSAQYLPKWARDAFIQLAVTPKG